MEGTQDGRAVVVTCEVRPAGDGGGDGAGESEEDAAGEGEGEVAEHGREALVLWVDIVG